MEPRLASIRIYPFKSLDPQALDAVRVLPSGALENDRRFAFVDEQGTFVNGKRFAELHRLRARYDLAERRIELQPTDGIFQAFDVSDRAENLCRWMNDFLRCKVALVEDAARGLPDDDVWPGPTLVSTATLEEVARWFPGLDADDARLRFRANLEIDGVPAFWEDRLSAAPPVRFALGDVAFDGTNACQRCAVPARSPLTGDVWPDFARIFRERRLASLPAWSGISADDHGYRLTLNTRLAPGEAGGVLRVGDALRVA